MNLQWYEFTVICIYSGMNLQWDEFRDIAHLFRNILNLNDKIWKELKLFQPNSYVAKLGMWLRSNFVQSLAVKKNFCS
jgi:hypothetical protein